MTTSAGLSYRRAGETEWVSIDPSTTRGQRLLALFGITTHPDKEKDMSAATAETFGPGPRLRPVTDPQAARMGLFLQTKHAWNRAKAKMRASARSAWGWIEDTFHLEAARQWAASAWEWIKTQYTRGAAFLGGSGLTGLGLLTIATDTGRKFLGFLFRPVGWLLKGFLKGWDFVEQALLNEKREDGFRNWLSGKMADIRTFFIGDADPNSDRIGVIGAAIGWYFAHVYPHLRLDTLQMKAARSVGALLLGLKLVLGIAFLPFSGMFLGVLTVLGYVGVAYATVAPFEKEVGDGWESFVGFFNKEKRKAKREAHKASDHAETTAETFAEQFTEEYEKAKAEADARTAAEEATAPPEPPNRASRRTAKATSGSRRR